MLFVGYMHCRSASESYMQRCRVSALIELIYLDFITFVEFVSDDLHAVVCCYYEDAIVENLANE